MSFFFQGLAFTLEERQALGIHGLLPAVIKTQEQQLAVCKMTFGRYTDDLTKYIYLMGLLVSIKQFYNLLITAKIHVL